MGYINDMYGPREPDFVKGFLAAMDTYAVWMNGKRFIGSPEEELKTAQRQAIKELGYEVERFMDKGEDV